MTKQEYADYQERVARYLGTLEHVSTGPCPGCPECGDDQLGEPWFTWSACEICGGLPGNRVYWHGIDPDSKAVLHGSCCEDCQYYLEYGRLDDTTMASIESA